MAQLAGLAFVGDRARRGRHDLCSAYEAEQRMDRELFVRDFGTNLDPDGIPRCSSREVAEIALSFGHNLETSLRLLSVPRLLILIAIHRDEDLSLFIKAIAEDGAFATWPESEQTRKAVEARLEEMRRQEIEVASQRRAAELNRQIDVLTADAERERVLLALAFSVVSGLWTTFECLAKDIRVAALNSRPADAARSALQSLSTDEGHAGISRRSISVGLLARYGFDLREHLGTALAPKFDFTSLSGVGDAFAAAFHRDPELESIFDSKPLRILEATRHVVAHRAGRVDLEYLRRTGAAAQAGQLLSLTAEELADYVGAVRSSGFRLIRYIDSWLLNAKG